MINKKTVAEFIGTFLLTGCVVGSGIMAENLSNGNSALALLCNTIATGAILFVIIKMFSPISGAHFNPAVSYVFYLKNELSKKDFYPYLLVQFIAAGFSVLTVHYMFGLSIFQISNNHRGEMEMLVSEALATFGLISTILLIRESDESAVATGVALFICAGYWFTPSTSFANPAVLLARVFTNSFTGIAPSSVLYFFFGQLLGALIGFYFYKLLKK